jgi:hypothetical protein
MRSVIVATLSLLAGFPGLAQESLCNPCVDPPSTRPPRPDLRRTGSTVTVTAEDMRQLGIIRVADLIAQLPAAAVETGNQLLEAVRTIMPPGTDWAAVEAAIRGGVWRQDQAAVAVTLPRENETLVYVLVRQADGSYAATDATMVISRAAFGFFGWPAPEYERFEIQPLSWAMRDDGASLLLTQTRAWRDGQRYTAPDIFFVGPDSSVTGR